MIWGTANDTRHTKITVTVLNGLNGFKECCGRLLDVRMLRGNGGKKYVHRLLKGRLRVEPGGKGSVELEEEER